MSNRDRVALLHMLDHAREAVELIRGKSRNDLDTHRMLNLSLVRLVEVIGEAAARVSAETKQKNPDDLPPLINQLERLVSSEEK